MDKLLERIELLGVPVDVVKPENMEKVLFSLHEQAGIKQIVFITVWDLLKAKRNATYMNCLKKRRAKNRFGTPLISCKIICHGHKILRNLYSLGLIT